MTEISKAMPSKMLKLKVVHYVFPFSPKCPKSAICGLLEKSSVFRVTARVTQLFTFSRRISEKLMRNIGQGGRLKTICPEMFFDFQTGGCIVNP